MSKSRGSRSSAANSRPRDEMGRFESTDQDAVKSSGSKSSMDHQSDWDESTERCRNDQGRFESCGNKAGKKPSK